MSTSTLSWNQAGIAAGAALVGNLLTFAIGSGANASWEVGQPQPVGIAAIVASSIVPMLVGTVLFNRVPRLQSLLPVGGLVFAIISSPGGYLASQEVATGAALGAMHVITGLVWLRLTRTASSTN